MPLNGSIPQVEEATDVGEEFIFADRTVLSYLYWIVACLLEILEMHSMSTFKG